MQKMHFLDSHLGSMESAISNIDEFGWRLKIVEINQMWYVMAGNGETTIFSSDNREAVDAFIYGMGLAYTCMPPDIFDKYIPEVREWIASL